MKKGNVIFSGMLAIIIGLVVYILIRFWSLFPVIGYFSDADYMDYEVKYDLQLNELEQNVLSEYLASGKLTGELRGNCVHGYLYINENTIPIMEYYENETEAKYNISKICNYIIETLGDKIGISLDWLSDLVDDCYITKAQWMEITGNQMEKLLSRDNEAKWYLMDIFFHVHSCDMPKNSVFSSEIIDMKFYQYKNKKDYIIIGIPSKFQDGSTMYIQLMDENETGIEFMLSCNKVEDTESIQIPEEELSEKQVEAIKWVYNLFIKNKEA